MRISIIAAVAANRAIGYRTRLLYWLPNAQKCIKALTTVHSIIMGRRTFESLPKGALLNRRNFAPTRHSVLVCPGAECFASSEEALERGSPTEDVYSIGGASVYADTLRLADRLCLTHIADTPAEADAFFPEVDPSVWQEVARECHEPDEKHAYAYSFVDYERR